MVTQKLNIINKKIISTITNKYTNGLYSIKFKESYYNFFEGEELIEIITKFFLLLKRRNIVNKNLKKNKNWDSENLKIPINIKKKAKSKKNNKKHRKNK